MRRCPGPVQLFLVFTEARGMHRQQMCIRDRMEEYHEPFFYDEIIEGGHAAGANLKEDARTWAEMFTYLSRKLVD